jgi:hypothetical protein
MYPLPDTTFHLTTVNVQPSLHEMFREVHGSRSLHHGAKRTYLALCARFPGHGIPLRVNEDMVSECPICQKDRLPISALLHAATRETLFQHMRTIGMDHRSITAHDKKGYVGLFLIVELDTTGLSYPRLLSPYCCHNRFSPLLHLRCLCLYPI